MVSRFALEALLHPGSREVRRQDLDGDRAVQPRVARLVDLAHAARAEGRESRRAEPDAGLEGHEFARL